MEPPAGGPRQVRGDGRDDAPGCPGHHHGAVRAQRHRALLGLVLSREGASREADAPALSVHVADLDAARVAERLRDEQLRHGGRLPAGRQVHRLDQCVGTLPLVRLREARDGTAHRGGGTGHVVPVEPAEPGAGDEEGTVVVEETHGRVERLDTATQRFAPSGEVEGRVRALVVERGEPVDTGHRSPGPERLHLFEDPVGGCAGVDRQRVHPGLRQLLQQRVGDSALVAHHHDARSGAEGHASGDALVERRAQHRHGFAPRHPVHCVQVAADRRRVHGERGRRRRPRARLGRRLDR